ncbi:MAG: double-strand break repair protein AddB, partial [Pseudomonadota bacterium]
MRRRIEALYAKRAASFLPRLTPVGRIADRPDLQGLPSALSPLGLRLRLVTLISALLDQDETLAPRSALCALADSLATLMAEMHEEGVTPDDIEALQTEELARHWGRNAAFLRIITRYFGEGDGPIPAEALQAMAVDQLATHWLRFPPQTPVIVAGSTGSRGATARLMAAVARLPQGAVVLPGLDRDIPAKVWSGLMKGRRAEGLAGEDHPQFRLGRFAEEMGLEANMIEPWTTAPPVAPARNAWMSLALRPAPVTDAWLSEAPALPEPEAAFDGVTVLHAPSPRTEAAAIALRLRQAAETGQTATLVTPDRSLARAVTAALDRWGILPDDSAGLPLDMTNPGRLLALVADLMAGRGDAVELLAVLKHPLTMTGAGREQHLRWVESLELHMLRGGKLHPDRAKLATWVTEHGGDANWADWIAKTILEARAQPAPLTELVAAHIARAEALADGAGAEAPGALWEGD